MAILIILVGIELKWRGLYPSAAVYRLCFRLLLGEEGVDMQFAELQVRFYPEQCRATVDQRIGGGHTHIPRLDMPDDLILITPVGQLYLPGIHVESGIAVVVDIEVDLIAYFRIHIELYLLVEIEPVTYPCPLWQGRVVGHIPFQSGRNLQRALCGQPHPSRSENGGSLIVPGALAGKGGGADGRRLPVT